MQTQLLQIAIHGNHWMLLPYIRAYGEFNNSFVHSNSILSVEEINKRKKEKVRNAMMRVIAPCFIEILAVKLANREVIINAYQNVLSKVQALKYNVQAITRVMKSYSLYLVHLYCDNVLKDFYGLSIYVQLFSVAKSLRSLYMLFPENELLFDCNKSHGLELAPHSYGLSFGKHQDYLFDDYLDLSKSILKIPSTEDIAGAIKQAQRVKHEHKRIDYEFDYSVPEDIIKDHINFPKQVTRTKNYIRSDDTPYLYSYDNQGLKMLTGLFLIRNVVILELAIELPNIPLDLWLQLMKNHRSNFLIWRNMQTSNNTQVKEEQHRLFPIEHMLRSVSSHIKLVDYTLYKTCRYNVNTVLEYLCVYYKVLVIIRNSISVIV